jgi:tetratricopeptide (TPR) repeat protein
LFLSTARRVAPGFGPSAADATGIVEVCRTVEGMPLAIVLAASWVDVLPPSEIAGEIERGLAFLETALRDVPARHRSVRATFDSSWQRLGERERGVLAALSVFRGGFTREAAGIVAGADLRVLSALVRKSLLHRNRDGRYELHELLRQYCAEELAQVPGIERAVRDRHSEYYAAALEVWAAELRGARPQDALAEMDLEIENARAAWDWAAAHVPEQIKCLDRSMDGLCTFYEVRGRFQEGEAACKDVAAGLKDSPSVAELRVPVRALAWQAYFAGCLGQLALSRQLAQQGLGLLGDPRAAGQDTRRAEAFALWVKAFAEYQLGEREEARRTWHESLALCQAAGDRREEAHVLWWLGWVATHSCLYDQAERLFEESLRIQRMLDDASGIAGSLVALGAISGRLGNPERGERLLREAIAIRQEIGDRISVARGYDFLGGVYASAGRYRDKRALHERALVTHDEFGYPLGRRESLWDLASAELHLGEYGEARAHLQMSLELAQRAGNRLSVAVCLYGLGSVELAEGAHAQAVSLLEQSLDIARETGYRETEMRALIPLAYAVRGLGDHVQARRHFCAALRIATQVPAVSNLVPAVPAIALLLADRGEAARAVELYALALRYPHVANSRWYEDVVGKHIAAAAATLPPDVVAAAEARGRARDLQTTLRELLAEMEAIYS